MNERNASMKDTPLRAAVIGCGALANGAHLPTLQASPIFDLHMVCDVQREKAEYAADKWGAKTISTNWREVVENSDIDLVVLCTHIDLRSEAICAALEAGKPVYSEKPLASTREETMRILRAADDTATPLCVGHNRRSSPAMQEFKRLFEKAREVGADRGAIVDRVRGLREPIREELQTQLFIRINDDSRTWKHWAFWDEHGIMLSEMTHFVDLAMWLMPSYPVEVYACGSPRGNFTEILKYADGSQTTLMHSMVGNFDYPKELFEASALHVSVCLDHYVEIRQRGLESEPGTQYFPLQVGMELTDKQGMPAFWEACDKLQELRGSGGELPIPNVSPNKGHREHLESFGRHVRGDGPNPCPARDTAAVTNVTMKLVQSAREGRPLPVLPEDIDFPKANWEEMRKNWF